jgi:2-amino-4-hydroxy-6-hydroxymethyldihydropteridine diphosphokinase
LKAQKVILLMGGNQGRVNETLENAVQQIAFTLGKIINRSSVYSTKAWGPITQPDFLNIAIVIETIYPPHYVLKKLLGIEQKFGRRRDVKYGPRTLDIDILFYGQVQINSAALQVPHPEIQNRRFALVPLNEILPHWQHPVLNKSILQLLQTCPDTLEVKLWP